MDYIRICSSVLNDLPSRTNNVIERRFGLKEGKRETLESIGENYGITRERVRQIEEEGFSKIQLKGIEKVFKYFSDKIESLGGLKKEDVLLSSLGGEKQQNQVLFLLTLANGLEKHSEDNDFHCFWTKDKKAIDSAKKVISLTLNKLKKDKTTYTLDELFNIQKSSLSKIRKMNKDIFQSYIEVSKNIQENGDNQIGLNEWVEINPKGVKDKAYLILKKQGKPLHFRKVADLIGSSSCFEKNRVHTATVHNELIKDPRFVLVGRGLYALVEWGYEPGIVKDVIIKVLKGKKPLSKDEIAEKVLEQRIVKRNTIFLNLQDKNCFFKNSQGKYINKK